MIKREKTVKTICITACELFTVITIIMLLLHGRYSRLPLAFATLLIILAPEIAERLFCCKLSLPVYLYGLFYSIGPMLGQCHDLYYTVSWWDKLLHISGGVMFALFGFYICEVFIEKCKNQSLFSAIFAVCFSMAIAVLWEFAEFGADTFLGMDMQDDSVITSITSYLLDDGIGVAGSIQNIEEVIINGELLPVKGYIDIGLIDSMLDMLWETLGALTAAAVHLFDQGRHPAFTAKHQTVSI